MLVEDYLTSKANRADIENQDVFKELSEIEQKTAKHHLLVKIIGKQDRPVSFLMPKFVEKSVDSLIARRNDMKIPGSNKFLFARQTEDSFVDGCALLRSFAYNKKLLLDRPDLVTSTNCRKRIATAVQVLNLHDNEQDWFARSLGHDIHVHRHYYRRDDDTIQLTKMAKLYLAVESGKLASNAGKTLDEIELDSSDEEGNEVEPDPER